MAYLSQWYLKSHNHLSIPHSLHCSKCLLLAFSQLHAYYLITSCAIPQGFKLFCFQVSCAFIWLLMLSCPAAGQFAIFACPNWWNGHFWSVAQCILCWLCCWERFWMLQDMDDKEASCIFSFQNGMLDQQKQSKIHIATITKLEIVMLTVRYHLVFSISIV